MIEAVACHLCFASGVVAAGIVVLVGIAVLALSLLSVPGQVPPLPLVPSPGGEWAAALADARRLPPEVARDTRYQTLYGVPEDDRPAWRWILTFHLWSTSREGEPGRPRRVTDTLYAIRLSEFGWPADLYGRLTFRDPYFHVLLTEDGKRPKGDVPSPAPWLGSAAAQDELRALTHSQVPLLRADWFFVETSIQDGRGTPGQGTGYYDWIGVTDRASFQRAVGHDPKLAAERHRQWRAIVKDSGVAHFPRQVERDDALGGGYWFTLDVLDDGKGDRNGLRKLGGDFRHQAEEHYAIGPAGLPWTFLCDAEGNAQASAPDKIGTDDTRPGRRRIIDVNASCVRCHKEILRPLDNWFSELTASASAEVPYEKAQELRRLYVRDLQAKLKQDRQAFVDRLKECNGLTPKANAELYARLWDWYAEGRLSLADCAREAGVTPRRLGEVLLAVQRQKKLDPVLADLVRSKPLKIRREHWEEVFPIVQTYLIGEVKP